MNLLTGRPVTEDLGTGALTGAVGGAGAAGLGSYAGTGGTLGKIGTFAAEHPLITSGAIGLGANLGINALTAPDISTTTTPSQKSQFSYNGPNYSYNPATFEPYDITKNRNMFPIYQPSYAAGGLTDVDSYASDAQNVPQDMPTNAQGGIQDIQVPNTSDVADPSGYMGNSAQMFAQGGKAIGAPNTDKFWR